MQRHPQVRLGRWLIAVVTMTGAAAGAGVGTAGPTQRVEIPVVRLDEGRAQAGASLPVTRLDDRDRAADLDMARAVSLTFAEPLSVRDVLLMLFRGTPLSVVFDPAANGTFMGELSNLSMRQALEAVLFPAGLDYGVKGAVVHVFPRHPEMRMFEVNYLDVRRAWQRRTKSLVSSDPATPAADLSSAAESDFFADLEQGVRSMLSGSGRVHIDRNAGLVQVTDFADRVDQVGLYIEAVTLRATRQVRLATRVLEVMLTENTPIDWTAVAARSGIAPTTSAGITVDDFNVLMRAIGTFGTVRVISAPQLLAMNNEPAVMRIGSDRVVFEPSITPGASRRDPKSGAPQGIGPIDGFTLTITPQISSDGIVHMSVSPTLDDPRSVIEADVTLRVRSGQTAVIAGLLRDSFAGIASSRRAEVVILITPTVVNAGASPVAGAQ